MDRIEKIYQLHRLFRARRRPVPRKVIEEELECSRATAKRLIAYLRDFLGAPVQYVPEAGGYAYVERGGDSYELPGVWFSADELLALLTLDRMLERTTPGILEQELAPLKRKLSDMLAHRRLGSGEIQHRVRILGMASRAMDHHKFAQIAGALVRRKKLHVFYHGRARDQTTERNISPQRLVHYRDNWYLDAWCHLRNGLRSFSLDRLHVVKALDELAEPVPETQLDAYFAASYGIFAGKPVAEAVLRFTPEAARWVADEQWYPAQKSEVLPDGGLELRIPYSDPRELIGDILRHGPQVEVLAPETLRRAVHEQLRAALGVYQSIPPRGVWWIENK